MEKTEVKCDKGDERGSCCCNCKNCLTLMKHPWNKDFGKGSISESCGYVCVTPLDDGSGEGKAIYSDSAHGVCEMHEPKS